MATEQLEALNVLSQFVRDHDGYIPIKVNELVSYSCSRYDLPTLEYQQAERILTIYTKNLNRLRKQKVTHKASLNYKTPKKKHSTHGKLRTPRLSFPNYKDVNDNSESDMNIDEVIGHNTFNPNQNTESTNIMIDNDMSKEVRTYDMNNTTKPIMKHKNCCRVQIARKCHKTTKMDCVVFIIWLFMMVETLFGVGFGLVRIGFGVQKLNESLKVTQEICYVFNYTKTNCEYEYNGNTYDDFRYDYRVNALSKCNNVSLYRRNDEKSMEECGIMNYNIHMNVSCYIGDCDKNEYSFVGYHHLTFEAKFDIELGCIVLIVTTVPFVSFICWLSFCYRCGPK